MNNKKGSMDMVGLVLVTFIGVIVAISIFSGSIIPTIGQVTTTATLTNLSEACASGCVSLELAGWGTTSIQAINETNATFVLTEGNYTLTDALNSDGLVKTFVFWNTNGFNSTVNVTYTTNPDGYIGSSSGRSMALLVAIFSALAIAIATLVPTFRNGVMNMFGR